MNEGKTILHQDLGQWGNFMIWSTDNLKKGDSERKKWEAK